MKIILILRVIDVYVILRKINVELINEYKIFTVNVEAYDKLLLSGVKNVYLIPINYEVSTNVHEAHINADREARYWEFESASCKANISGDKNIYYGWDYLNLYYIRYTWYRYIKLSKLLYEFLPSAEELVILWRKNAQDYYFDSVILRSIIIDKLKNKYTNIIGVNYFDENPYKEDAYKRKLIIPEGKYTKLVHLPTAFYDYKKHVDENKGQNVLDIESPYFDLKISNNRANLSLDIKEEFEKYIELNNKYQDIFFNYLHTTEVSNKIIELQVNRLIKRSIFQLENYQILLSSNQLKKIKSIELSDHEAGLQGPIVSFANAYKIPVNYWPHSSLTVIPTPLVANSITTKNFYFRKTSSFVNLNTGLNNQENQIKIKEKNLNERNYLKSNVLILHNEIDDVSGISLIDFNIFNKRYSELIELLISRNYDVRTRQKPSHSYVNLGLSPVQSLDGPLSEIIDWPNLCISIGATTTALVHFWSKGAQCIHLSFHTLIDQDLENLPDNVLRLNFYDTELNSILLGVI